MLRTKVTSLILAVLMLVSVFTFTACDQNAEAKLGLGITVSAEVSEASPEADGTSTHVVNFAAVLVDGNGKITACDIDTIEVELAFTAAGEPVTPEAFTTKRELGDNYGMKAYAGTTEWYEQVDNFETVVIGKTMDEVNALVVNGYGNDDVTTAGCTIAIADFVAAINKAYDNATTLGSSTSDTVKVSVVADYSSGSEATEEAAGTMEADLAFAAVSKTSDGKITGCVTDAATLTAEFDMEGIPADPAEVQTKRELGDNYGMKAYAGTTEWYAQADALDKYMVG